MSFGVRKRPVERLSEDMEGLVRLQVKGRSTSLTVGVVIAKEDIEHVWQDHRWRPLDVVLGLPELTDGELIREGPGFTHYFAGAHDIE
ncbi:MAG: DUF3305 domain-containing protein, partial [Hyphomicrobiaceae bacterium]